MTQPKLLVLEAEFKIKHSATFASNFLEIIHEAELKPISKLPF
jgi:hypothetical protein